MAKGLSIALDAVREKKATIIAWLVGGFLAMYFEALAIAAELDQFPGGAKALATYLMPTLEAMRILRWPADRIDTLGGYLVYHNVTLVALFLAIFAALQGAKLIRHMEETQKLEVFLASGVSRQSLIWYRSLGFIFSQLVIGVGLGLGTALALWNLDKSNFSGSFLTLLAVAICTLPAFGLGLLFSQFSQSSRLAASVASIALIAIYAIGNIADKYEYLGWVKWISPFYYANQSRPLIPGFETDYLSWAITLAATLALIALSGLALTNRDIGGTLFTLRQKQTKSKKTRRELVPRSLIGDLIWRQKIGILGWGLGSAALLWLFAALMPGILDIWGQMSFLQEFSQAGFGNSPEEQYLALIFELLPAFIAGYVVMQGSSWTNDLVQGRVDLWMVHGVRVSGIVLRRLAVNVIATQFVILFSLFIVVMTTASQYEVELAALIRVYTVASLIALALSALSLLVNSITRTRNSTLVTSIYIGASWLVVFMAPYLEWPKWIQRLSIFDLFGHPYIEWPTIENFVIIAAMVLISLPLAIKFSRR